MLLEQPATGPRMDAHRALQPAKMSYFEPPYCQGSACLIRKCLLPDHLLQRLITGREIPWNQRNAAGHAGTNLGTI